MQITLELYQGQVFDRLKCLPVLKTKYYETYREAHYRAELLAKKYGSRANIDVRVVEKKVNVNE